MSERIARSEHLWPGFFGSTELCGYTGLSCVSHDKEFSILSKDLQKAITVRHLRVISELAEFGLVARVADALNVTQSAVSKQITDLERLVGMPIVTRDRNRLYLTPVGLRLAEHARQILAQIDRVAFDLEAMAAGVTGTVTVGAVSSVAPILLPAAIGLFKRSAPQATVAVVEGHFVSLLPMLEAGSIDLLIARTWQPRELPGIEQKVLLRESVVIVAGSNHSLADKTDLRWDEIIQWPWILPQVNAMAREAIDALFAQNSVLPPDNIIASTSLALNLEILRQLPALGLFPQSLARAHAARGDIVILPLDTQGFLSEARCFWRQGQEESNGSFDLFMRCLLEGQESP